MVLRISKGCSPLLETESHHWNDYEKLVEEGKSKGRSGGPEALTVPVQKAIDRIRDMSEPDFKKHVLGQK